MPGLADEDDADVLDQDEALEGDEDQDEGDDLDNQDDGEGGEDEAADEFAVEFDEAEPGEEAPESSVIRQLRAQLKEARATAVPVTPIDPGPKPKMADFYEGHDDPEAAFETALDEWKGKTAQADAAKATNQKGADAFQASVSEDIANYATAKRSLKVRDFDIAEATVEAVLSPAQQIFLVGAANAPAQLAYALGKHPARLAALAAIENPIKFAAAVARLEGSLKVTTKTRKAAEPEVVERGSASLSVNSDKRLEKLEKDADRTGDRTALIAYKRKLKEKRR